MLEVKKLKLDNIDNLKEMVERGKGLTNLVKNNWVKQPNGNYSIFDVPFFKCFDDEKRGKLDGKTAAEVIQAFQDDKQRGKYPPIHCGHNPDMGVENRPVVGYLDNLHFNEKDQTFYADLVEIPEDVFQKVKKPAFPGRSVEYHQEKKKILSLALLESQPDFFEFPILAVSSEPTKILSFGMKEPILLSDMPVSKFQEKESDMKLERKFEPDKGEKMEEKDPEIKNMGTQESKDIPAPQESEAEPSEPGGEEHEAQEDHGMAALSQKLDKIVELLSGIFATKTKASESEKTMGATNKPEPAQMQSDREAISRLQKKVAQLEYEKGMAKFAAKFKQYCDINNLDFRTEYGIISKFKNQEDGQVYLDSLHARVVKFSEHPVSNTPRNANTAKFTDAGNKMLSKFSGEPVHLQQVARMAFQDWADTDTGDFRRLYPVQEDFVNHCVSKEREKQGFYRKEIRMF